MRIKLQEVQRDRTPQNGLKIKKTHGNQKTSETTGSLTNIIIPY
jgi:hypothetical protein